MQTSNSFNIPNISGDIVIKEGTIGSKMYFIQEGIVDIVMANGEVKYAFKIYKDRVENYLGHLSMPKWIIDTLA